ncbi:OmpA family protein [Parabacteroides johnsonii]|uniref:OmpA family protein n=1 Tax=Parabacteroides johnsonii TaxID=387661 RepID=UPI00265D2316|nr:OmpA family protein [Parabacteroides johnsonii]
MKKYLFIMVLCSIIQISFAQSKEGQSSEPARKATFINNGFWDHWFIGAGAGANIYFGDRNSDADFFHRFTVAPEVQFGKWINPYLGTRIKGAGLTNLHTFNDNATIMSRNRFATVQADLMWSMTDYFMKYSSDRVYSLVPYVSFGWAFGWDYTNQPTYAGGHTRMNGMTLNAGIINNFKLSDRVTLSIEFAATAVRSEFNQVKSSGNYDILGTASAGLIFNLGKTAAFSEAELRNPQEIDALNSRINELYAQNQELAQRPVDCPEPEVITEKVVEFEDNPLINNVVLFKINQTKVDPYQGVNIYNIAQYLKDNPQFKVRVIGYTDRKTGTSQINEKLSAERAQNVARILISDYNISRDRIKVEWVGDKEPPFDKPEWNRAVILYVEQE